MAYQEQSLLDNFDQDVTFCTTLDEKNGNYTIIALATCILGTLSSPTYEAYTISGTESLNQLCVEQEFDSSLSSTWSIMGYATQTISFDDSTISLNMQPATSLVYLYWQDIFAHDVIDDYFIIYHSNDIMRFDNNGTPIYSSLSSTGIHGANVSPADYSVKNIYRMCNLFPGSSMNIFAMAFSGNNYTSSPTQKFTVVSGHQYVFSLDCATFKLTPYEGVFGTRASCDEFEPIAVKSLPSLQHIDFPKKQFK